MNKDKNLYRPKPSDFHSFECYQSEFVRNFFCTLLVTFAHLNFSKVNRIKILPKLKEFTNSPEFKIREKRNEFIKNNKDFALNSLLDYILIGITFENYFKAKLLLNGFVIHEIKKDKDPELFKEQKSSPIESNRLIFENKNTCEKLKETTLGYNFLLKNKKYQKYYSVDKDTLNYLSVLNAKRNSLHLYLSEKFTLGKKEVSNLEKLKTIVTFDIALLNNTLVDKTGAIGNCKLKVEK